MSLTNYAEHYKACKKAYVGKTDSSLYADLYDVSFDATLLNDVIGEEYLNLVTQIAKKIAYKIDNNVGCHQDEHAIKLNDWCDIEELNLLASHLMPHLEEKVFHCHLKVEFLHPYRTYLSEHKASNSWLWHYDDCPREFLKFVIYLNDVTENSGCFQYLQTTAGQVPTLETFRTSPYVTSVPKLYPSSRIPPSVVSDFLNNWGHTTSFTGPAGTYALLTPNIMHRGTIPQEGAHHRDAVFFFIRPSLKKQACYINKETKSFLPPTNVKTYQLD